MQSRKTVRPEQSERRVTSLHVHDLVRLLPEPTPGEFAALLDDVREHGVLTPLEVTRNGVVLDGGLRLRAAVELELVNVPVRIVDVEDEAGHILSLTLARRHLNAGQRAALVLLCDDLDQHRNTARKRQRANLRNATEVAALPPRGEKTRQLIARRAGVGERTVQQVETVRKHSPELFAEILNGTTSAQQAALRVKQQQLRTETKPAAMPKGTFEIILADPPWRSSVPESPFAPENHYPTMTIDEIKGLHVPAAPDSLLYLWSTGENLPQALEVMSTWGFDYKGQLVWVKPSIGLGNWARYRHELILIGRRGRFPCPPPQLRPDSVIEAPRTRHSEKPAQLHELVERAYPHRAKLELFARKARPGWATYGNQIAA